MAAACHRCATQPVLALRLMGIALDNGMTLNMPAHLLTNPQRTLYCLRWR